MESDRIKVGVIGVGALGRHHARLYRECPGATLVGVYDRNAETARRVGEELGTAVFSEISELAAAAEALSVAVPTDLHYGVVKELLQQDRHVLVEKPITPTVAEADQLVKLAKQRNLILGVGHVERFNPVLTSLDEIPGEPRYIECQRLATYPPPRPGLRPRGTEVSVVLDLMIHDLDVILALVNSPVKQVSAVGVPVLSPTEDIANAHLVFENGCVANITASRVSQEYLRKIRVFKPNAYLSLDYQEQSGEMAGASDGQVWRKPVPVRACNALQEELQDFCATILEARKTGKAVEPRVSGAAGQRALELAEEILRVIAGAAAR